VGGMADPCEVRESALETPGEDEELVLRGQGGRESAESVNEADGMVHLAHDVVLDEAGRANWSASCHEAMLCVGDVQRGGDLLGRVKRRCEGGAVHFAFAE
jgi:hypothetical protein